MYNVLEAGHEETRCHELLTDSSVVHVGSILYTYAARIGGQHAVLGVLEGSDCVALRASVSCLCQLFANLAGL